MTRQPIYAKRGDMAEAMAAEAFEGFSIEEWNGRPSWPGSDNVSRPNGMRNRHEKMTAVKETDDRGETAKAAQRRSIA